MSLTWEFLLACALVAPAVSRAATGDFFAPPALIVSAWCSTLGLYQLSLLYYPPLSADTATFLTAAVLVMVAASALGIRAGSALFPGRTGGARSVIRPAWLTGYALLGMAGVAWYGLTVVRHLGWQAVLHGAAVRVALHTKVIPSTFLFLEYFCVAAPVLACALALTGTRVGPVNWILATACVLGTLVTTDRTQVFTVVLTCLFAFFYHRGPRVSWARATAVVVAGCLALVTAFFAIGYWQKKTGDPIGLAIRLPTTPIVARHKDRLEPLVGRVAHLYLYATGSYAALDGLLQDQWSLTRGAHTFYPAVRVLQRAGIVDVDLPSPIAPFRPIVLTQGPPLPGFNAYTFLYYPLMDFGRWGALVYAGAVALMCGIGFGALVRDRMSPARILVAAHLATALVLTVFVNKFNNTGWWYVALLTLLPLACTQVLRRTRVDGSVAGQPGADSRR